MNRDWYLIDKFGRSLKAMNKLSEVGSGQGKVFYEFGFDVPVEVSVSEDGVFNCTCKDCSILPFHRCIYVGAVKLFGLFPSRFRKDLSRCLLKEVVVLKRVLKDEGV